MKNLHHPFIRLAFIIALLFASVAAHAYDCIYGGKIKMTDGFRSNGHNIRPVCP